MRWRYASTCFLHFTISSSVTTLYFETRSGFNVMTPKDLSLTFKELEILEMAGNGLTNQEIAAHLQIATTTVKWHMSNVLCKLNAKNRTHASHIARQLGLFKLTA